MRTPKEYTPNPQANKLNLAAYGKYLAEIASGCAACHTQRKGGRVIESMKFAGGRQLKKSWGTVTSANITPDKETGIGNLTKEDFIGLFKSFQEPVKMPEDKKHENTVMPWAQYSGLTEEDLGAIYEYLRTVKSIKNRVEKRSSIRLRND